MAGFARRRRVGIDHHLSFVGRGSIRAALFDLGSYPAAIPSPDGEVRGEVYEMADAEPALAVLDNVEGFTPGRPEESLYLRQETDVRLPDGTALRAWTYFYNKPLGGALRIASGDYRRHAGARASRIR